MSDGVVYVLQAEWGGPVKIGFTRGGRVEDRLREIQTGNPSRLVVRGAMPGTMQTEKSIHYRLAHHRLNGEWFVVNSESSQLLNDVWDTDLFLGDHDHVNTGFEWNSYRCVWGNAGSALEHREGELRLYWELDGDSISDEFHPDETSAASLWRTWTRYHAKRGSSDDLAIYWYVQSPSALVFEAAPFTRTDGDWLTYYTWPRLITTHKPIRWGALPIVNKRWNSVRCDKGGFIQEHTGWKPSAFQRSVSVRMLEQMAGAQ